MAEKIVKSLMGVATSGSGTIFKVYRDQKNHQRPIDAMESLVTRSLISVSEVSQ